MQSHITAVSGRESELSKAVESIDRMKARGRIADWKQADARTLHIILKLDTSAQRRREIVSELKVLGCEIL